MSIHSDRRPSWEKTWLEVASAVAKRSLCTRDKVGAVIVDATNRIVATGYNNPPRGFEHASAPCTVWCDRASNREVDLSTPKADIVQAIPLDPCYRDCPSLHAEQNALSVCDRKDRAGGTIYVTSAVCVPCAKLIANSGLSNVVVKIKRIAEHRASEEGYNFLRKCGIIVEVRLPTMR